MLFVLGLTVPIAPIANPTPGRSHGGGRTMGGRLTMNNEVNRGFTHNSILIDETEQLTRTASGITLPVLYPSAIQKDYIPNALNGTRITASPGFGSLTPVRGLAVIDLSDNLTKVGKHTIKTGLHAAQPQDQTSFSNNNGSQLETTLFNPYDSGFGFLQCPARRLQHVSTGQRFISTATYGTGTPMICLYPEDHFLSPDAGLWSARRLVSTAIRFLAAGIHLPAKHLRLRTLLAVRPAILPGTTSTRAAYDPVTTYLPPDVGLKCREAASRFKDLPIDSLPQRQHSSQCSSAVGTLFGFAWDVTGKQNLVIRSGGGIYYDRIQAPHFRHGDEPAGIRKLDAEPEPGCLHRSYMFCWDRPVWLLPIPRVKSPTT